MLILRLSVGDNGQLLDAVLNSLHLGSNDGKHFDRNSVEFVEATPLVTSIRIVLATCTY